MRGTPYRAVFVNVAGGHSSDGGPCLEVISTAPLDSRDGFGTLAACRTFRVT